MDSRCAWISLSHANFVQKLNSSKNLNFQLAETALLSLRICICKCVRATPSNQRAANSVFCYYSVFNQCLVSCHRNEKSSTYVFGIAKQHAQRKSHRSAQISLMILSFRYHSLYKYAKYTMKYENFSCSMLARTIQKRIFRIHFVAYSLICFPCHTQGFVGGFMWNNILHICEIRYKHFYKKNEKLLLTHSQREKSARGNHKVQ